MARFSEAENVKFMELHFSLTCLLKTTSVAYKNKDARESAYKDIVKSGLVTSKDVANTIKNIRSAYYQELKRMETSKKSVTSTDQEYINQM
jgi:hypothetical protein